MGKMISFAVAVVFFLVAGIVILVDIAFRLIVRQMSGLDEEL